MDSNLNIYVIDLNNSDDFEKIVQRVKKDSVTNILYLDCKSLLKTKNSGIANNLFENLFLSEDSGIAVLFTKGSMTRKEIETILNKNKIENVVVDFHYFKEDQETDNTKEKNHKQEYRFARDQNHLLSALKDSFRKGFSTCSYVPEMELEVSIGYKDIDEIYHELLNQSFVKGIITLKDKEIFLIKRDGNKKLDQEAVETILKRNFVTYRTIKNNKGR